MAQKKYKGVKVGESEQECRGNNTLNFGNEYWNKKCTV